MKLSEGEEEKFAKWWKIEELLNILTRRYAKELLAGLGNLEEKCNLRNLCIEINKRHPQNVHRMARRLEIYGLAEITGTRRNCQIKILGEGKKVLVFLNAIEKNENLKETILQMVGKTGKGGLRKHIVSILYLFTMRYRSELMPYYSINDMARILSVESGAIMHQYRYLLKEEFITRKPREIGPRWSGFDGSIYENIPTKKGIEVVNLLVNAYREYEMA